MSRLSRVDKFIVAAFLLSFAVLFTLSAQPARQGTRPVSINGTWQIKPQVLSGTGTVDLAALPGGPPPGYDVYLCNMWVSTDGTANTITVFDKQTTPVGFLQTIPIAANTTYPVVVVGIADQACPWFPNGITVAAGTGGHLSVHASGKYIKGPPF